MLGRLIRLNNPFLRICVFEERDGIGISLWSFKGMGYHMAFVPPYLPSFVKVFVLSYVLGRINFLCGAQIDLHNFTLGMGLLVIVSSDYDSGGHWSGEGLMTIMMTMMGRERIPRWPGGRLVSKKRTEGRRRVMDIFMRTSDCLFRTVARCVISAPGISVLRIIITDDCCLLAPFAARHNCSSVVGWPPLMMIAWLMITRYLLLDMKLLVLVDLQPATIVFLPPLFVFRPSVLSCDLSVIQQ